MTDWLNQSISLGSIVSTPLEILGFLTGAVCVYLNTRQNVLGWFFGIVNAVLYAVVFWQVRLYADMGLQAYYFITSIYGWWLWLFGGKNHDGVAVSRMPARLYTLFAVIFVVATWLWGYMLSRFTDASLTYADSALTVASLIGQWMMARKYIENWILWIAADACYVGLYYYKGLHLTAILYIVFLVLAGWGYVQWKRDLRLA
ncbi:nicotinamide riboside transporter PnuC [Dyadobacter sandarakinus]|uniref:Nicotinamide riboside transporter PnuC n=1 Tax=Dyadobacter sandarakinus TaxID=2747268 RepID=A0ABX7IGN3_9BACT|nr:nicotinamide riboside transporter PnuC [Dyadobacter sandarakinus]QRR04278.1 nicotinamide mononucleotide transporter [Dyadobacter sandarakinus]